MALGIVLLQGPRRRQFLMSETSSGRMPPAAPKSRSEMCSGTEADSYLRLIDSCITQLKAQGPSRTCNESKGEEEAFDTF